MDESYKSFEPVSDSGGPAIGKSMKAYSGFYLIACLCYSWDFFSAHSNKPRPGLISGLARSCKTLAQDLGPCDDLEILALLKYRACPCSQTLRKRTRLIAYCVANGFNAFEKKDVSLALVSARFFSLVLTAVAAGVVLGHVMSRAGKIT